MSIITIKCPDCGKEIRVNIKTIGDLRMQLEAVKRERDAYKAKLAALEFMNNGKCNSGVASELASIFKGFK
jgi:hypothetical protein